MALFTTRIRLHSASKYDYSTLHSEMEKEAFKIVRKNENPENNALVAAEEYKKTGESLIDVNAAVFRAARKTGKKYSFTIIKEARN